MDKEVPSLLNLCARFVAPQLTRAQLPLLPVEDLRETLQRHMDKKKQIKLFHDHKEWNDDGQLVFHVQYNKEGRQHGELKEWYRNGRLFRHIYYKNGKRHGEFKWWYKDGQLWYHDHWKDGKEHGEFTLWCPNGQLERHNHWKDGKQQGVPDYDWWTGTFFDDDVRQVGRTGDVCVKRECW